MSADADRPADDAIRERAVSPAHSVIVRAPAGSGKTTLLVQRCLALLASVDAPEEVVAVTFTRKAAAEMRHRVIAALAQAAADPAAASEAALRALERDRSAGWNLADAPGRLRIMTIDALAGTLARALPVTSGLGGLSSPVDDATDLYGAAAAAVLGDIETRSSWSGAVETVLRHLDNDIGRARELIALMLARRDQWLLTFDDERTRGGLADSLDWVIEETLAAARHAIGQGDAGALLAVLRFAAQHVPEERDAALAALADIEALPAAEAAQLPAWQAVTRVLLTKDRGWRRRLTINQGFPAAKAHPDASEMKQRCQALIAELERDDMARARLGAVALLPAGPVDAGTTATLAALLTVLRVAAAQLKLEFAGRGAVDFVEIAEAAQRALGDEEAPTEFAMALDYGVRHLLIDEFQDTSLSQFFLIEKLTRGWQAGDGRTLFIVGDPMQSIYRFRQANVHIFEDVWRNRRLGAVPLSAETLTVNFRSQPALIEWVNAHFPPLATDDHALVRGDALNPQQVVAGVDDAGSGRPPVVMHGTVGTTAEHECEMLAGAVAAERQHDEHASIAVLARSRQHLAGLGAALTARGIAWRADDVDRLSEMPVVQDLHALARALLHRADEPAWYALLRAPWCGLDLHALHRIAGAEGDTVWARITGAGGAALPEADRARLARLIGALEPALDDTTLPFALRLERCWLALGGPAAHAEDSLRHALALFRCLEALDADNIDLTPGRLAAELGKLYATPAEDGAAAVELMTIHKAKGLEFDIVLLPGLGKGTQQDRKQLLEWSLHVREDSSPALLFAPIPAADKSSEPLFDYVHRVGAAEGRMENRRVLYVALTRARRRVHLFGHVTEAANGELKPRAGSFLDMLWPAVEGERHAFPRIETDGAGTAAAAPALQRQGLSFRLPAPETPILRAPPAPTPQDIDFDWAGRSARLVGTVVHEWLKRFADDGLEQWLPARRGHIEARARIRLVALGTPPATRGADLQRVMAALDMTAADERGQWILSRQHGDRHAEYRLAGELPGRTGHVALDRTFIDADGTRWIIDYKTGSHGGGSVEDFMDNEVARYRDQLNDYAVLMARIDPAPIRLGLYFPLLGGWREWPYAP